jgi:hypothetical protein
MEIKTEALEPGNRMEELLQLFNTNFKNWPPFSISCTPTEYYKWKYIDNVRGTGFVTVALDGDKIVGCIHAVRTRCKIGDQSYVSTYGSDAVVDKTYRKRGIYRLMTDLSGKLKEWNGIQFHYVSTHLERKAKSKTMPFRANNLVRIKDIKLHAQHRDTSFLKRSGYSIIRRLREKKRVNVESSYDLVSNQEFNDPTFWLKIRDDYDFIIERDIDYLNWRYINCPDRGYYVKQAVEDGHLLGYIVCKIDYVNEDYPSGNIVDLLALSDRSDVVDVLLGSAIDYFDENKVNIMSISMVEGHGYKGILGGHGFVDTLSGNKLTFKAYEQEPEQAFLGIKDNSRICLHYGDTDFN